MEIKVYEKEFPGDFLELHEFKDSLIAVYDDGLFEVVQGVEGVRLVHVRPPAVMSTETNAVISPESDFPRRNESPG